MNDDQESGWESQSEVFLIGDFEVDPATNSICKDSLSVKLEPRAMSLLLYLAHRPATVVSREELEREIWTDMVVGYDALNNTIAKLRKAFNDDPKNPQVIHTVPKRGYRLIAEVGVSPLSSEFDNELAADAESHPSLERKLAAILYADVVDYSRLTGLDEEGTHRSLSKCLDMMTLSIDRYHGNVVHFAGDAILADFATVSNALGCAVTMQQELAEQNDGLVDDRKMQFRIGVNLGEVIVDRNDIYGDGVNVAARLEGLADPGGICLSGTVFDAIGRQLPLDYNFLGERRVKNIDKPVRAYQARLKPGLKLEPPQPKKIAQAKFVLPAIPVLITTLLVLVAIVSTSLFLTQFSPDDAGELQPGDKPVIAVLPFDNISDNPAQNFYARGMTGDLITGHSNLSGLAVIGRHSVEDYDPQEQRLEEFARELGASHVVEGSVLRFDGRIRVNVNLIEVATSQSRWSERYDVDESELFDLHNRMILGIVQALGVTLSERERKLFVQAPTNNLEAYDYYLRAEKRRFSKRQGLNWDSDILQAIKLLNDAIALDPKFAEAYVSLAMIGLDVWSDDETGVMPGISAKKLAYDSASKVNQLDPQNPAAYSVLAVLQATDRQHDIAVESSRQAIDLGPGNADIWAMHAEVLIYDGQAESALVAIGTALKLNPKPPHYFYGLLGEAQYLTGRYHEAVVSLAKANWFRRQRAMTFGQLGRSEEAKVIRDAMPPFANLGWYRARLAHYRSKQDFEHMIDGLRKAGVPENAFGFEGKTEDRINSESLEEITVGKAWSGIDGFGRPFEQQISKDGRIAYNNHVTLLVGKVWITGNKLCVRFRSNVLGRDDCGYVYQNQDGSRDQNNEYVWTAIGNTYYFSVTE
jgi:adenylate cyclase